MSIKPLALLLLLCLLSCSDRICAQAVFCPPNIDFEQGNFNNWEFYIGNCCPLTTPTQTAAVNNRHTLTNGTGTDPYGGFPIVAPGSNYSMRLGNNSTGRQAERARYYVRIPSTPGDYIFIYRYAVVFQDPSHAPADQPRFQVSAFDSATGDPIPCTSVTYVATSNLPGFYPSASGTYVWYRPWSEASINLSNYNGKTIALDFATGDCQHTGHFGYAYVDMDCGLFEIARVDCNSGRINLEGPPGFKSYTWMDTSFTTVVDTHQSVVMPVPSQFTKYALIVTPYFGLGCADTFYTGNVIKPSEIEALADTAQCMGDTLVLNTTVLSNSTPVKYRWTHNGILNCDTCAAPTATVNSSAIYYVEITDKYGCHDTDTVVVDMNPLPIADAGPDTAGCIGDTVQLNGNTGYAFNYWTPNFNLSNTVISNPKTWVTFNAAYDYIVVDTNGCRDTDRVVITADTIPIANAGPDTTLCSDIYLQMNGSGGGMYDWYPETSLTNSSIANPWMYADSSRRYFLSVTNIYGCSDTDDVFITVDPKPLAATINIGRCLGDTATLYASGGGSYLWAPSQGLSNPNIAVPALTVSEDRVYTVVVTNSFGCMDTATATIRGYANPVAEVGPDTSVCPEIPFVLHGRGGKEYIWFPADGLSDPTTDTPHVNISAPAYYTLVVTNEFGCVDTTNISVDIIPVHFEISDPDPICRGDKTSLYASGGDRYQWYPETGLSDAYAPSPVVSGDSSLKYSVVITEVLCGRFDTLSTNLTVNPLPEVAATAVPLDCGNEVGYLQAKGADTYIWQPSWGLNDAYIFNPTAAPAQTTEYIVEGTDENGCRNTDTVILEVYQGDGRLFIPDAFTPNGDGINDCYRVIVPGDVTQFQFSIYNRWGERVFHTTQRDHCWDGTYKGFPAELSTFFYYYTATSSICGKVFRKGDMHLLR